MSMLVAIVSFAVICVCIGINIGMAITADRKQR